MDMQTEAQITNQQLQADKSFAEYLRAFNRRKWQFALVIIGFAILSAIITLVIPAVYKSSAIILIEQQEIPQDLVRTTVTSYADQRIQVISQRVMTTSNMKAILDKYNLYEEERKTEALETVLDEMRDDITLNMISADVVDPRTGRAEKATIAFSLAYENESPRLAQKVANEVVSLFLNENLKNRTEMAEEATQFLQDEAVNLSEKVAELETQLADFKEINSGSLPEMVTLNIELMDRQEREITEVRRQIQSLREREIYLDSELAQLSPVLGQFSETGERILGPKDRLKILETRYISLISRYSEEHPDVVDLKNEIAALEQETGTNTSKKEVALQLKKARSELTRLKERYADEYPDVKKQEQLVLRLEEDLARERPLDVADMSDEEPDNPAYIRIQADLEAARAELDSMYRKEQVIQDKLQMFEERLTKAPEVEREYRSLLREYENAVAKFREIKAKQMEAQLAQNLESENKGERFTLIEPPLLPEEPYKPNRLALMLLGLFFSASIGIGTVLASDALDRGVYGRKGLENVIGEMPLSVIPYIETSAERRKRIFKLMVLIACLIALGVLGLIMIHMFIKPLDVLWFLVLRRLGIS